MRQATAVELQKKLGKIKIDLLKLKKADEKNISLKGLLKGVNIDEQDIEQTKKSLFKSTDI